MCILTLKGYAEEWNVCRDIVADREQNHSRRCKMFTNDTNLVLIP